MGDKTEAGNSIEAADNIAEALATIRFDRDGLVPASPSNTTPARS